MHFTILVAVKITWAIVCLVWLIAALFSKRTLARQSSKTRLAQLSILLVGYSLLAFDTFNHGWLALRFVPRAHSIRVFGLVITVLGAFFAIRARLTLGSNWSGRVTLKQDHRLISTGPYAFVRHPIYSGLLLAFAGTALVEETLRALVGFALVFISYALKMRTEEMLMMQTFPDDYPAYRRRVKALIPGLF